MASASLADRLSAVFALEPAAIALEFDSQKHTWGDLATFASAIGDRLTRIGVPRGAVVGWVALNLPATVASLAGLVISGRCAGTINPHMGPGVLAEEISRERFPAIVADPTFWQMPGVVQAAREAGSAGLEVEWQPAGWSISSRPDVQSMGAGPHREPMPEVVIERLSSGTTGPPKRSPYRYDEMVEALEVGQHREGQSVRAELALKRSPAILFKPLAHGGGSFAVLLALYSGRPITLHTKFTVDRTVDAIRRHRPKVISLVPAMISMILDANVPPEALSSLIAVRAGTAPLPPAVQERFEERYGVPVLIDYGATEFGGATSWSLADHRAYAKEKRGSVGKAVKGVELRIVDPATKEPLPDGAIGLLEVKSVRKGEVWISTTDLARLDEDGFLYIHGRADDAIVRGGFKILPDEVANVLRSHPDVRDAFVVGVPDDQLGQVPVGVIEVFPDRPPPEPETLREFVRDRLTPYQVPVAFKYVDELPRTPSMKIIRQEVLALAQR